MPDMARRSVPLDDVLSRMGIGPFHYHLLWLCGFGFSAAAMEVVLMAFITPQLRVSDWEPTESQLASLSSAGGLGAIIGEVVWGMVADRHGRRPVFTMTVGFVVIGGLLSAGASSLSTLRLCRFLVGFGYGGNIAVDFTLFSELLPTHGRGKMMLLLAFFWPLGQSATCLLAWGVIPRFGWRWFAVLSVVPSLLTAFFRPFIMESPRWHLMHGYAKDATLSCRMIAVYNGKTLNEVGLHSGVEVCLRGESTALLDAREHGNSWDNVADSHVGKLLSEKLWRTTVGLVLFSTALNVAGYGTLAFLPSLLQLQGEEFTTIYREVLITTLAQFPGIIGAAWAATTFGRLAPLKMTLWLNGIAMLAFGLVSNHWTGTVFTCVAAAFLEWGYALCHLYVPEVFPTELRATGSGMVAAVSSVLSFWFPFVAAGLLESPDSADTPPGATKAIMLFSFISILGAIATHTLLHIETKSRDLDDSSTGFQKQKSQSSSWADTLTF